MLAEMDAAITKAKRRLQEAEARFDRDKHGKNAFIGSSSWGNYAYARKELEDARAEFQSYGCPVCAGDCASANPPVSSCPMRPSWA